MEDPSGETVFWLSGAAGSGKTAISQSVVNIAQGLHFTCATFFFSRISEDQRDYLNVIPTLAYQLAENSHLRPNICAAIDTDMDIRMRSVRTQVQKLILDVLTLSPSDPAPRLVIVLDALDECKADANDVLGGDLIPILLEALRNIPFAKVFLTSRPESSVERLLSRQPTIGGDTRVNLDRDIPKDTVQEDIERYFRKEFRKIKPRIKPGPETDFAIRKLVREADGLFSYARAAMLYIRDPQGLPDRRLQALVDGTVSLSVDRDDSSYPLPHDGEARSFSELNFAKYLETLPTQQEQMVTLQRVCVVKFTWQMVLMKYSGSTIIHSTNSVAKPFAI
jgi:hypothetical protein